MRRWCWAGQSRRVAARRRRAARRPPSAWSRHSAAAYPAVVCRPHPGRPRDGLSCPRRYRRTRHSPSSLAAEPFSRRITVADQASISGTHVTKRPTHGPVPISGSSTPTETRRHHPPDHAKDWGPVVIPGLATAAPCFGAMKKVTGYRQLAFAVQPATGHHR